MTKTILTYCNDCERFNNHAILFLKKYAGHFFRHEEYSVVECMGCNTISFLQILRRTKRSKPVHFNYPDEDAQPSVYNFLPDKFQSSLPRKIRGFYNEVISAFETNSPILSGVGLRTLVEAVCNDQSISGRNLAQKIQGLHNGRFISKSELPILDKLRIIGNDSVHKMKGLSMYKLELALGIINHVLISIYVLPKVNDKLKID
ncbi:MAG TPA: DUF4145 domain-containing protein [Cyclobacteriaceae bacterium]|nr:DUF4145 domain-containing protein [Cyclobacteriaceae bacterium]